MILEIVDSIATIILWEFLLSASLHNVIKQSKGKAVETDLQEFIIVGFGAGLAYNDGGLFIIQFEDDEFRSFGQFELLECFRAGWINGNTRARLHVVIIEGQRGVVPCLVTMKHVVWEENKRFALTYPEKMATSKIAARLHLLAT